MYTTWIIFGQRKSSGQIGESYSVVALPKVYSQDMLDNMFKHPYTKIEFVMNDLQITRKTASRYLQLLVENEFLEEVQFGRHKYFINQPLLYSSPEYRESIINETSVYWTFESNDSNSIGFTIV